MNDESDEDVFPDRDEIYKEEMDYRIQLAFLEWIVAYLSTRKMPYIRQHNALFPVTAYVKWLLDGYPSNFLWATQLTTRAFYVLRDALLETGYYEDQDTGVKIDETLVIFLHCMTRDKRMRDLCHRYKYSLDTVKRVIERDCIGAVDRTHVSAWALKHYMEQYRNRHGDLSQNVLVVVDHDMRFVYVKAGYLGSAHDALVLRTAITDAQGNFPMPLVGKFYVVDSTYRNMSGFMSPHRGHQHHLRGFWNNNDILRVLEELFNYRHAQVRNIVERLMYCYSPEAQAEFVLACCMVHNIIIENNPDRPIFDENVEGNIAEFDEVQVQKPDYSEHGSLVMHDFRKHITDRLWHDQN